MGYTIGNNKTHIHFVHTNGTEFELPKGITTLSRLTSPATTVTDETAAQGLTGFANMDACVLTNQTLDDFALKIQPSEVDAPVVADNDALYDVLEAMIGADGSTSSATGTFTNADLVANVLSIPHNLDFTYVSLNIVDPAPSSQVSYKDHVPVDADNTEATFAGGVAAGTWTWIAYK